MSDEQFIQQLGLDLSDAIPTMLWCQEPCSYKRALGTAFHATYFAKNCGHVVAIGRCVSIQMGADAERVCEHLRAKGYEVVEAFDNGVKVR